MDRIKINQRRLSMIMLAFFLLLAGAFAGIFFRLDSLITQSDGEGKAFYVLTDSDYENIVANDGAMAFRAEQVIQEGKIRQQAMQMVQSVWLPLSYGFLGFLLLAFLFLWILLNKFRERDLALIAKQLSAIMETDAFVDHKALSAAYGTIRQQFKDNLNDYQRLNSYLSHEQKNALAILRADVETSGHSECLQLIDEMTDGINDVLTLSESQTSAVVNTVDVALVCAEVCDNYRRIYDQITFTFNEEDDTEIAARYRWIYRAVANLLDNAVKYGDGKQVQVSVCTKKNSVIVRVEDHGIGISREKQEKIFSHRYRVDELNKDGYGIGLSLVSHVCDLCGGFVTVESEVGKGSVFYLSFPEKLTLP